MADNVRAQHRLLTEKLGISHLRAVVGFSMGAAQAYQWAVSFPDFVDGVVPICGSARNAIHCGVFLEGVKSALVAARCGVSSGVGKGQSFPNDDGWTSEKRSAGIKAFARVYAGWGFSQAFYREKLYARHQLGGLGLDGTVDEFMVGFWEPWANAHHPDDLLAMLQTWQLADISAGPPFNGDFHAALHSIQAQVLVCPGRTDLYFPPEDSAMEVEAMQAGKATLAVIPSIWGHWAGGMGDSPDDWKWLDGRMAAFFETLGMN